MSNQYKAELRSLESQIDILQTQLQAYNQQRDYSQEYNRKLAQLKQKQLRFFELTTLYIAARSAELNGH